MINKVLGILSGLTATMIGGVALGESVIAAAKQLRK